jgi:hypothetical protein
VDSLRQYIENLLSGRQLAFALADDLLIRQWSVADGRGSLPDLAIEFLNTVLESVQDSRDSGTMLRAKLAQVDVATTELVGA